MPNKTLCPSCSNEKILDFAEIDTDEIVSLYKKNNISTEELFKGIPSVSLLHCSNCDLKFFKPSVAGDENFYNQLQEKDWYFLHSDKTEFTYSNEFVSENNKVLDVGSGRGVWAKYVSAGKGVFYQGIEFSSKSIELAQKDKVNVIKESVEEHAQKFAGYYDVVVTFQVLEHVEEIRKFIASCVTCLRPGGKLIIAVPNNEGFLKKMVNNWLNMPPHHINHWNERSLEKLADTFKLRTIAVHKEKVTTVHKLLFYNILVYSGLSSVLGYKRTLVDNSLKFKILNKISYWLAKLIMPFSKKHLNSDGHTIIVVLEK